MNIVVYEQGKESLGACMRKKIFLFFLSFSAVNSFAYEFYDEEVTENPIDKIENVIREATDKDPSVFCEAGRAGMLAALSPFLFQAQLGDLFGLYNMNKNDYKRLLEIVDWNYCALYVSLKYILSTEKPSKFVLLEALRALQYTEDEIDYAFRIVKEL